MIRKMDDTLSLILGILTYLYISVCLYFMAKKTGEDNAWFAFVPILDIILLLSVADMPLWWLVLCFIPLVNLVAAVMIWMAASRAMGKPSWMGLLILIPVLNLVFIGYLAFS